MFLDADDWVDRRLVASARAALTGKYPAAVIDTGMAVDFRSGRAARLPGPRIFDEPFFRVCGSSAVLHMQPGATVPLHDDPYPRLPDHYRLPEQAWDHGGSVTGLPVDGAYVINTAENHSEMHGPFAQWRQRLTALVNKYGEPLSENMAARFSLRLEDLAASCNGR